MHRPDLVLAMTDQQRFDQVGYETNGHYETPNIDGLAQRGVVFTTAYSASTTCVPARASLLTGFQNHRLPTQLKQYTLREGFWTVAHALRHAGYETALIGKMHFTPVHAYHGFETVRLCEHLGSKDLGRGDLPHDVDDYHDWLVSQGLTDWRAARAPESREARKQGRMTAFPTTRPSTRPHGSSARRCHSWNLRIDPRRASLPHSSSTSSRARYPTFRASRDRPSVPDRVPTMLRDG